MLNYFKILAFFLMLLSSYGASSEVLFQNSVVSNNIDFIKATDPTISSSLKFKQTAKREMPDKRRGELFDDSTYVFEARYTDGSNIEIWAHSDFASKLDAEAYVRALLDPLGRLPARMRTGLSHIVLHNGNETAFAEHLGHFFVLYSANIITRLKSSDLEETLFHESVHATLDAFYLQDANWLAAQKLDNNYVTQYAEDNPHKEDFAETALFAYTHIKYPGRLPNDTEDWLLKNIPNRLEFIRGVFAE